MKLRTFGKKEQGKNALGLNKIKPSITFLLNANPSVRLNNKAVELIEFFDGDRFMIAYDEENKTDWYIYRHPDGLPFKRTVRGELKASCALLIKVFQTTFNVNKSIRLTISNNPVGIKIDEDTVIYAWVIGTHEAKEEGLRNKVEKSNKNT